MLILELKHFRNYASGGKQKYNNILLLLVYWHHQWPNDGTIMGRGGDEGKAGGMRPRKVHPRNVNPKFNPGYGQQVLYEQ